MKKVLALSMIAFLAIGSFTSCKKCGECVVTLTQQSGGEVCYTKTSEYDAAKSACEAYGTGVATWKAK